MYADRRSIQWIPGETLIGAIKSALPPGKNDKVNSHLIRILNPNHEELTNEVYYRNLDSDTSSSEEEIISEEVSCDELYGLTIGSQRTDRDRVKFAYLVTRSERTAATT